MSEESGERNMTVENFLRKLKQSPQGAPFILKQQDAASTSTYAKNFSSDLASDSDYFRDLNKFLSCVDKNASKEELSESQQEKVCGKEFKALRLHGFDNQLMYHNVNKRYFGYELAIRKHEAPI
jgi:hypothetical protein